VCVYVCKNRIRELFVLFFSLLFSFYSLSFIKYFFLYRLCECVFFSAATTTTTKSFLFLLKKYLISKIE
jgi:hypothetical protein